MKLSKARESADLEFIVSIYFTKMRVERTDRTRSCSGVQSSDSKSVNKEESRETSLPLPDENGGVGWPEGLCPHGFCSPWAPGVGQSLPKTGPLYLPLVSLDGREGMLVATEMLRHVTGIPVLTRLVINKVSPHLRRPASQGHPCFPVRIVASLSKTKCSCKGWPEACSQTWGDRPSFVVCEGRRRLSMGVS